MTRRLSRESVSITFDFFLLLLVFFRLLDGAIHSATWYELGGLLVYVHMKCRFSKLFLRSCH